MAKKNLKATESEATKVANKSEEFFNKHKKLILGGLGAILLIIVAIIGYKQFIVKPRELKANNALAKGQMMFGNPSDSVTCTAVWNMPVRRNGTRQQSILRLTNPVKT